MGAASSTAIAATAANASVDALRDALSALSDAERQKLSGALAAVEASGALAAVEAADASALPTPRAQGNINEEESKDTAVAIANEVARVRAMDPAEHERLGAQYVEPEAIFAALEKPGEPTVLLRGSWLMEQMEASWDDETAGWRDRTGFTLLKRGEFPPEAYIGAAELRRIYAAADFGKYARQLPFIAISHFWRTPQHPDPDGETLELIVDALRSCWENDFEIFNLTDVGIFFDYCSLFQEPRTEEQLPIFKESLSSINLWYAHQLTTVWMVTAGRDRTKGLGYHEKGW